MLHPEHADTDHYQPIIHHDSLDVDTMDTNHTLVSDTTDAIRDLLTLAALAYDGDTDGYHAQAHLYADAATHARDLTDALDTLTSEADEAGERTAEH